MKKLKNFFYYATVCCALIAGGSLMASCGSDDDEPEPVVEDEKAGFVVADIYNTWVLTVDEVDNGDGTVNRIAYSGGHSPYYTYNRVSKGNAEGALVWKVYEYPASGTGSMVCTKTLSYTIDGKTLYNAEGETAGNVTGWDPKHKYANLVISWEPGMSPKGWSAACRSSYLNGDWVKFQ